MENLYRSRLQRSRKAIKNWWLLLLLGIIMFVVGILVFRYPGTSYVAMAVTFGVMMLLSGVINIALAASTDNIVVGRGWLLAEGIIELILGLILCLNIAISAITLPLFLGFWLLFRSFGIIGIGSDMWSARASGAVWTIVVGVLLLITSIIILAQPLLYGVEAVVIWVGVSFIVAGIALAVFSFQLRNLHRHFIGPWDTADDTEAII